MCMCLCILEMKQAARQVQGVNPDSICILEQQLESLMDVQGGT